MEVLGWAMDNLGAAKGHTDETLCRKTGKTCLACESTGETVPLVKSTINNALPVELRKKDIKTAKSLFSVYAQR